jgi:hypothetical protein
MKTVKDMIMNIAMITIITDMIITMTIVIHMIMDIHTDVADMIMDIVTAVHVRAETARKKHLHF